jgi:hypothetical protein
MRLFLAVLACTLFMSSCFNQDDRPADLLPEGTYIDLMVELQLLQSYQERQRPDSTKADSLRQAIFEKYGASEEHFSESHRYYQEDVEAQRERISQAIEKLRKDRISAADTTEKDSTDNDSTAIGGSKQ